MHDNHVEDSEKLPEIGEFAISILDTSTEEEALKLLQEGIDDGPFNKPLSEVTDSLLFIVEYTLKWPRVRDLAIKQLRNLSFSDEERLKIEMTLAALFLRENFKLDFFVTYLLTPSISEREALNYFNTNIAQVLLGVSSEIVAKGLVRIFKETPYESVRIEAIKTLEALRLFGADNEKYLDEVKEILRAEQAEKMISLMANRVIDSADEVWALYEFSILLMEGSRLHAKNLEAVLRSIKESSIYPSVKDLATNSLKSISSDPEIRDLDNSYKDDSVGSLTWRPLNTLN